MSGIPPEVARKLSLIIPMLGSDRDNEVLAAVGRIKSALTNERLDLNDLGKAVEELSKPAPRFRSWQEPLDPVKPRKSQKQIELERWSDLIWWCIGRPVFTTKRERDALYEASALVDQRERLPNARQAAWLLALEG